MTDLQNDYKTRLELRILLFLVRFKPPNKRFRTMKIDFFDTIEKYGIDSLTKELQLARNRKIKFRRFIDNINVKPSVRPLYSTDFERFRLTFSTNIDNFNFAFLVISDRSTDTRFQQKYEVRKTLQNLSKSQNVDAFATSKTSKY